MKTKINPTKTPSGGTSVLTVLFIIFVVLKLTKNITWSWWWVTSPIWIPLALVIVILGIVALVAVISSTIALHKNKRRKK
jgi:membrane protein YdbS with pleckstrin-like domain